jgi:predicted porin
MNKKLLIAAVGAALAAGSVAANAAVTVYGKVNLGIAQVDNGTDGVYGVTDDASRLGFKGDEDLGGGLKAIYLFESGVDADNGGIAASARDHFAGLAGSWGSFRLGQFNSAYKLVSVPLEIFGDTVGDFTHPTFTGESRTPNTMSYTSPNWGGFSFSVEQYSPTENIDNDATDPLDEGAQPIVGALTYSMGPLYLSAGTVQYGDAAVGMNVGSGAFTVAAGSAVKLAAKFQMGPFGIWFIQENASGEVTTAGGGTAVGDDVAAQTQHIGLSFAFGANTTLAATQTIYSETDLIDDNVATQTAIGLIHNLSKSTKLNFVYTSLANEDGFANAGRILSNGGMGLGAPAAGDTVTGLQAQISMSF